MARGTSVTLGPVLLDDGELTMRSPRLRDAEAWSTARLANRKWLERAFPAWGSDWAAEQSATAWVERVRHLRQEQQRHGACPLVVFLDGQLIGEIGIDSIDTATGIGEASAWLTRDHGSPDVMITASALLLGHVFGRREPLDRVLSPVATTSRRGRAPGLSAVGFGIEATVPRPLSDGTIVDHDMWIVHNTPDTRAALESRLDAAGRVTDRPAPRPARLPTPAELRTLAPALSRVGLRTARRAVRRPVPHAEPRRAPFAGGVVDIKTDAGTATTTFVPRLHDPAGAEALAAMITTLVDTELRIPQGKRLDVRLPPSVVDLAPRLTELGFVHAATYRGNPDGPHAYAGEQVWSRPITG